MVLLDVAANHRLRAAVSPPRNPVPSDTGTGPNLQYSDASNCRFAARGGGPTSARKRRLPTCLGHIHLSTFAPEKPTRRDVILTTTRQGRHAVVPCMSAHRSDTPAFRRRSEPTWAVLVEPLSPGGYPPPTEKCLRKKQPGNSTAKPNNTPRVRRTSGSPVAGSLALPRSAPSLRRSSCRARMNPPPLLPRQDASPSRRSRPTSSWWVGGRPAPRRPCRPHGRAPMRCWSRLVRNANRHRADA